MGGKPSKQSYDTNNTSSSYEWNLGGESVENKNNNDNNAKKNEALKLAIANAKKT